MTTTKTPNYTAEQTAFVINTYLGNPTKETVEALAENLGKTVKSIVAKLAQAKVYQKSVPAQGAEAKADKKTVADQIRRATGFELPNLEKLTLVELNDLKTEFSEVSEVV